MIVHKPKWVVYIWCRQEDGSPYYVGKSVKGSNRPFTGKGHLTGAPTDPLRVITQEYGSEAEAYEAESLFISLWGLKCNGTGILRNRIGGHESRRT